MANGDITRMSATDAVSGISSKKSSVADEIKREEQKQRLMANARKRFRDNELKAIDAYNKKVAKLEKDTQKKTLTEKLQAAKKAAEEEYKVSVGFMQKAHAYSKAMSASIGAAVSQGVKNSFSAVSKGFEDYLGVYSQYMSGIETRLQGSSKTFSSITGMISKAVGASQYVSQKEILKNLSELVKQGINYNVEQRAFLATVSDRIADTFNAFDSNLARIIRIQQADSTAARLGLESQLTKFFNNTFGDTSYLSQMFDTVSASLLTASSTLDNKRAVEFEYTAQKWLGSLSSVGVSDSTIQQLAKGLGYVGSGGITELSGDSSLNTLFALASGRAGLDYGSLFTGGLSTENANKLLKGIVQISQEVSTSNNRVVLAEFAKVLGMDISDLMALSNLTAKDLVTISSNLLSYGQLYGETEKQISTIGSRMTFKDRLDTMFDNVMSTVGERVASNAGWYTTWLITDLVEKATGGISIPTISVMGSGIDLETTVTGLMKTGIVGFNTIAEIGTILSGLSGRNNLSLDKWGASDVTTRGKGFTGLATTGVSTTTSQTTFIGNSDESDIYAGSVGAAKEEAQESIAGEKDGKDMAEIIENEIAPDVRTIVKLLDIDGIVIRTMPNIWPYSTGDGV